MSQADFKPFYADGQRVMPGDRIFSSGPPERVVIAVYEPDHEVSRFYKMENGCAEITPATIEPLPLNDDIALISRESERTPEDFE
jgi:hypothetical protein